LFQQGDDLTIFFSHDARSLRLQIPQTSILSHWINEGNEGTIETKGTKARATGV